MGGRREEMVEDVGGGGVEEGDFAGPGHFVTELPKRRVEMLEGGGENMIDPSEHAEASPSD